MRPWNDSANALLGVPASGPPPLWPYTWGRAFRALGFPWDLLYRLAVTRTVVLGREHLAHLPSRVILAGTHHSFADMPLVRRALAQTAARRLSRRLARLAVARPARTLSR